MPRGLRVADQGRVPLRSGFLRAWNALYDSITNLSTLPSTSLLAYDEMDSIRLV